MDIATITQFLKRDNLRHLVVIAHLCFFMLPKHIKVWYMPYYFTQYSVRIKSLLLLFASYFPLLLFYWHFLHTPLPYI